MLRGFFFFKKKHAACKWQRWDLNTGLCHAFSAAVPCLSYRRVYRFHKTTRLKKKKRALNKIQRDQSLIITVSEESRELCLSPFKERKQSLFLSSSADLAFLKESISLMGWTVPSEGQSAQDEDSTQDGAFCGNIPWLPSLWNLSQVQIL